MSREGMETAWVMEHSAPMNADQQKALNLRAGEIVEVRSPREILSTLDESGTVEALPFMPEMLGYCGQRLRVFTRADRTCDTIQCSGMRGMNNAVTLEGVRCDGQYHGGCQAGCLIIWKEAWLKRASQDRLPEQLSAPSDFRGGKEGECGLDSVKRTTLDRLITWTRLQGGSEDAGSEAFSCQTTELWRATYELKDPEWRQFLRDLRSGTVSVSQVARVLLIRLFNWVQFRRGGLRYPCLGVGSGSAGKLTKTPKMALNLVPGELVQVKTTQEIEPTLDPKNKNRGLSFDVEMVKFCGGKYRVLRRVERIIDERTGKMMRLPNECIVLDGVVCPGEFHSLCSRGGYPFWREIWLRRADGGETV